MKTSLVQKFGSIREKNGNHSRMKSSEAKNDKKSRPLSSESKESSWFSAIFKTDPTKPSGKEKEEQEREQAKIQTQVDDITRRLTELNLEGITTDHIRFALESKHALGDVDKAIELLRIQQKALAGIIEPYNPNVHMVGAENRGGVTCYLDALLFAMFAKLDAFECMLKNEVGDEKQRKLAILIRVWVNMLRTGKMIHTDFTEHLQDALANCGWEDAQLVEQQDTSEAFAFITDQLQLPLLTLQVDMFHQGRSDKDDHKTVQERLLNLAVPPDPDGKGIKLEDCMEDYFNTKVEIMRYSLEEKVADAPLLTPEETIRLVTAEDDGTAQEARSAPGPVQVLSEIETSGASNSGPPTSTRPAPRHRATSVIQRVILDDQGQPDESTASASDPATLLQRARRRGATVVKAVTVPSWMFSRLIPWHSSSDGCELKTDADVARHFNQRPVVGICLKRYMMSASFEPIRHNTFIDIPDTLRLPHFMMVDDMKVEQEPYGLSSEYKLVLQSVVCHRGTSLHAGHYVAFARVAPKLLTENRRHDSDPPPDYEEAQWVKFDDIQLPEDRVSYVDDIREALREEMPYLLFYQILPVVDITVTSTNGSVTEPPSYHDTNAVEAVPQTPTLDPEVPDAPEAISRSTSGYFDSLPNSGGPSVRVSYDLEPRVRLSLDDEPYSSGSFLNVNSSRRQSVTFSESALATPAITPDGDPTQATPPDEAGSTRLSRAAARFTKKESNKSRPGSQAGENRISVTISRLGTLMRTSKEPLRDGVDSLDDETVIVTEGGAEDTNGKPKEREQHHHHHHHHRKEKTKSRKEKGKDKENEAERECMVM